MLSSIFLQKSQTATEVTITAIFSTIFSPTQQMRILQTTLQKLTRESSMTRALTSIRQIKF